MTATVARPMSVKLDQETRGRMDRLAQSRRRSTHWLMREAIQQYIEREEKLESYREHGIAAWNAYQASGQHVTAEEADDWLAKLETGQDVAPPACHA